MSDGRSRLTQTINRTWTNPTAFLSSQTKRREPSDPEARDIPPS